MSTHRLEHRGFSLKVRERNVEFSYWPMARETRRFGLQSRVFASDPWNVFERAVHRKCPELVKKGALAYLEQAHDFFIASQTGGVRAAKPLLVYYCFMNLVKAFILTKQVVGNLGQHHHGLTPTFATGPGPGGAGVTAFPTGTNDNLFDLFFTGLTGAGLTTRTSYSLDLVLPQILLGHRLWCGAADQEERFIEIDAIQFRDSKSRKECWIRFDLLRTEYSRLGYTQAKILSGGHLGATWEIVRPRGAGGNNILRFQTKAPLSYTHRPSDVINRVVQDVRHSFWRSVTIVKPFRKYYVYVADPHDPVLPQQCSVYLVFFYLASITRYRPDQFDELVSGPFGAFIQEFIENQPNQWLYLLASEFAEQEIARAAVV
jgi:hypothetical protein